MFPVLGPLADFIRSFVGILIETEILISRAKPPRRPWSRSPTTLLYFSFSRCEVFTKEEEFSVSRTNNTIFKF